MSILKVSALLGAALSLVPSSTKGQGFFLPAGQSIEIEFNKFAQTDVELTQFTSLSTVPGFDTSNGAVLEAFENSTSEASIAKTPLGPSLNTIPLPRGAWNDLQGVIRVTAGSTPLELDSLRAVVVLPDHTRYDQVLTVVPEPTFVGVIIAAGVGALVLRRRSVAS